MTRFCRTAPGDLDPQLVPRVFSIFQLDHLATPDIPSHPWTFPLLQIVVVGPLQFLRLEPTLGNLATLYARVHLL